MTLLCGMNRAACRWTPHRPHTDSLLWGEANIFKENCAVATHFREATEINAPQPEFKLWQNWGEMWIIESWKKGRAHSAWITYQPACISPAVLVSVPPQRESEWRSSLGGMQAPRCCHILSWSADTARELWRWGCRTAGYSIAISPLSQTQLRVHVAITFRTSAKAEK